ncbi:MAG: hypothetical protein ACFFB3_24305 [Candidatus Hodarchaeota archaeon]
MNIKQFIERERQLNSLLRAALDSLKEQEPQGPFMMIEEFPDVVGKGETIFGEK